MSSRLSREPLPALTRRPITARDLDAVLDIETRAYSFPWSRGNFVDALAAGYIAEMLEAAEAGLVGYFVAMPGFAELHLLNITVAPAWQGQGHGRGLLDALRAHAARRALAALWLEVRQSNQRARDFYRRHGFVEVGLRRAYYPASGRREDAIVMSLALRAGGPHGMV